MKETEVKPKVTCRVTDNSLSNHSFKIGSKVTITDTFDRKSSSVIVIGLNPILKNRLTQFVHLKELVVVKLKPK